MMSLIRAVCVFLLLFCVTPSTMAQYDQEYNEYADYAAQAAQVCNVTRKQFATPTTYLSIYYLPLSRQ